LIGILFIEKSALRAAIEFFGTIFYIGEVAIFANKKSLFSCKKCAVSHPVMSINPNSQNGGQGDAQIKNEKSIESQFDHKDIFFDSFSF
jgi:hypothetical protein